jgi:hypothetical protein
VGAEQAADAREDRGATRREEVFGNERKAIGEAEVDALRRLKILRGVEEEWGVVFLSGQGLGEFGMMRAERRSGGSGRAALLVGGEAMLTSAARNGRCC